MLQRTLIENSWGALYSDPNLAHFSWNYLICPSKEMGEDNAINKAFVDLYVRTIDKRNPGSYRLNELHAIANIKDKAPWESNELPWLESIFEQLMIHEGDVVHYKDSKVQTYSRLAGQIDPRLLVAWYLSGSLRGEGNIEEIIQRQSPFFAVPSGPDKSYADGHVHYGGVGGGVELLSTYLLNPSGDIDKSLDSYRDLLDYFRVLFFTLIHKICESVLGESSKTFEEWLEINMGPFGYRAPDWGTFGESCLIEGQYATHSAAWCIGKFAISINDPRPIEWLWLFTGFCKHYRTTENKEERAAILCWFQICNFLQSEAVMNGSGLTRFTSQYFFHPVRHNGKIGLTKIPMLFSEDNDCAEIKIGPEMFDSEFLSQFAIDMAKHSDVKINQPEYIFGENQLNPNDNIAYINELERWHFCCHFSRSSQSSYPKRRKIRDLWSSAENLTKVLNANDGWSKKEFLGGKSNSKLDFDHSRWVRGLDVAGDENALAIEWFAPILRWLRSVSPQQSNDERDSFGFHLSVHSGEDYAHPASGLRKVDETVEFCEMKGGDRLGHALALGIEPNEWLDRQGQVLLPLDEHLDNLVWLWHYATKLSETLPLASECLPILVNKIAVFSVEYNKILFDSSDPIEPRILYDAWRLRKNCGFTHRSTGNSIGRSLKEKIAVPDWEHLVACQSDSNSRSSVEWYLQRHIYIQDHLWQRNKMPMVLVTKITPHFNDSTFFELKETLSDGESDKELLFMAAIQDYLLTQYDALGLIIEANPTSNLYIARLTEFTEHPVFRWCSPDSTWLEDGNKYNRFGLRVGPVKVTINTDDPGVMPTTLRTEFSLLKEAALVLGIEASMAEQWIESLRLYGVEQFASNHQRVFEFERNQSLISG